MSDYIRGVAFCFFWFFSILSGYIVFYCPLFPILICSNTLYRKITDSIFRFWELYPTALIQILFGTNFVITGDRIRHKDMAVVVMNHRTRTDWNFLWPIFNRAVDARKHTLKFILKSGIRYIPGPGWVMQLTAFLYIKRCWQVDRITIGRFAKYMALLKRKCQVLVFPEGTDLTKETLTKSHSFAEKNGLEKYEHVLQPRTTGFSYLVNQLQQNNHFDALYDLTIAYPDQIPQTERNIYRGEFPKEIHCHIKRYSSTEVPTGIEDLKLFLIDLWKKKESTLQQFEKLGGFDSSEKLERGKWPLLYIAFVFWSILPFVSVALLIYTDYFTIMFLCNTMILFCMGHLTDGFLNFEINIFETKDLLWSNH